MNPIARFNQLLAKAGRRKAPFFDAFALATSTKSGNPSARMMLLKGADGRGFRFFTNLGSRKSRELRQNNRAALCFWWPKLNEQVRVEGRVKRIGKKEVDVYFATRPRGSQIGAWVSTQSRTLSSRKELLRAAASFEKRFKGKKVPRPSFWSGFVLVPSAIEFWRGRLDRLHDRILFTRKGKRWKQSLLYP